MKPKGKTVERDVRYDPIDTNKFPELGQDGEMEFYRFWCRPLFVVYEKWKNGIKMGYLILPQDKEIFQFESMIRYVEEIKNGETVCRVRSRC